MTDPITDPEIIRRRIADHGRWWHEIELAPGIVTPGDDSNRMKLPILDSIGFPADMRGMRALDIGCSDGYFTFEMERRGAAVLAIDFVPETYTGFATARDILGSRAEYRMDTVYGLRPERYGTFDVVLFMGVLYHLRKPLAALDAIRSVMKEGAQLFAGTMLIDEYVQMADGSVTTLDALNPALQSIPLWQAYPGDSLNGDFTNVAAPNRRALEVALEEAQFRVDAFAIVSMGGYARATAVTDERAAKYQRLDARLETTPFDPSVPYFLDEEGAVHEVTGRRTGFACVRCHAPLERKERRVECTRCGASFPANENGIIDFAPDAHYDRFSGSEPLSEEQQRGLQLEIEGSRRRIDDYYLPMIRGAHRVLDCGCGNGVSVETLAGRGFDAWGIDLSELRAWQWRERVVRDRLAIADAACLPFPDGFFDAVISSGVIEHIGVEESAVPHYRVRPLGDRDQRRLAFVAELLRVLAPGGTLYLDCPNGAFPIDFWHRDGSASARLHSTGERFLPTFRELRTLARTADPDVEVEALSPYRRLQFEQAGRNPLLRAMAPAANLCFRAMRWPALRWLAATPLNPFLVVGVRTPDRTRHRPRSTS